MDVPVAVVLETVSVVDVPVAVVDVSVTVVLDTVSVIDVPVTVVLKGVSVVDVAVTVVLGTVSVVDVSVAVVLETVSIVSCAPPALELKKRDSNKNLLFFWLAPFSAQPCTVARTMSKVASHVTECRSRMKHAEFV